MSALGDYIHLYKKHYAEYGVTRHSKGSPNPNYSMNVINNRISANVKPISKEAIAELERRLKINSDNEENRLLSEAERQKQHLINICYQLLYQRSKDITGANRIATMARGVMYGLRIKTKEDIQKILVIDLGLHIMTKMKK